MQWLRHLVWMLALSPCFAQDLCGQLDARVCLQSNVSFTISGFGLMQPGSALVLRIPGMVVNGSDSVSGTPEKNYRLENTGTLTDGQGGVWASETWSEDDLGFTTVAWVLTAGDVVEPAVLQIADFQVCQRVSDEPTEVTLAFSLVIAGGKRGDVVSLPAKRMDAFQACSENQGNLPVLNASFQAYVANVHEHSVLVTGPGFSQELAPGEQLMLDQASAASPHQFTSSSPLPVAFFSDDGDIDLVGLPSANHATYVVPHMAQDTNSWQNSFVFASNESMTLDWLHGGEAQRESFGAGAHQMLINENLEADRNWAFVLANRGINGFFEFSRKDGNDGSAWVAPVRTEIDGQVPAQTLYLPHVPADTLSFWTGYSLANTQSDALEVTMEGINSSGQVAHAETFQMSGGSNEVGIIGANRLAGVADIQWIRITANGPLTGLQLVGGLGTNTSISGFLLPHEALDALSFPLLKTVDDFWSGVAVLNTSNRAVSGNFRYYNASGAVIEQGTYSLAAMEKKIWVAPENATHAVFSGRDLVGFCLVGELTSARLGGYLGMPIITDASASKD